MRIVNDKSKAGALFVIIILSAIVFGTVPIIGGEGEIYVSIDPSSTVVSPGEIFTVNVSCVPGQPIKSFEFKLYFNASLLQVNSVSEGDIFDGFTTFFNDGTINNTGGTIVDIYDLIVGAGTVSDSGTLITISFTAGLTSGVSYLTLVDAGVTNSTEYLPIVVSDGNVSIEVYTLTVNTVGSGSVSKNPNQVTYEYGDVVTLTASADAGWTFSSWGGDLSGSDNPETITITGDKVVTATFTQNAYTLTVNTVGSGSVTKNPNRVTYNYNDVVTLTATASDGWAFDSWSGDLSGSDNPETITITGDKVVTATFGDIALPVVSNVVNTTSIQLDTDPAFGWVNITGDVTDNAAVDDVQLCIQNSDGDWNNVSMNVFDADTYYYNSSAMFSSYGNYSYFILAGDTNGNDNSSIVFVFSMPPNWDVNSDGNQNILDLVAVSNLYGQNGDMGWAREDVDNNGVIQVFDLVLVSNHYGQDWWN